MNLPQFLMFLTNTKAEFKWAIVQDQILAFPKDTLPHNIKPNFRKKLCPITAVASSLLKRSFLFSQYMLAAELLDLECGAGGLANRIALASGKSFLYHQDIRNKILEALDLV